jgi:hypothetical protein
MLLTKSYSITKRKAIAKTRGIFQNAFHAEMHQNDICLFFKNYF